MTRLILILVTTILAGNVFAQNCYLTEEKDQAGINVLYRVKGFVPKGVICRIEGECPKGSIGSDIKQEVIKVDRTGKEITLLDRALKFIGAKDLLENERLRCTVDTDKRQARLDSERAAREAEKQAREAERLKRKEAKEALKAMKGKVKDLSPAEKDELLEKLLEQAVE